ncbi:MAG: acyltransferase domain-containing protein, partial [Nanoarchaeota archaeon]
MLVGVFPGQGNQYTGMGLELYSSSSAARAIYDSADKITRLPIKEVSFHGTPGQQKDPVMA